MKKKGRTGVGSIAKYCLNCIKTAMYAYGFKKVFYRGAKKLLHDRGRYRMSIKLELYRVFKEVAEEGSVSAAAKNLYISQSAVSQTIKQLEEQLDVRLFTRGTRGVTLTSEGTILYDYVRSAISLIEHGEDKIAQTKNLLLGELVIGASDTLTSCFLLPFLERFHADYPSIKLRVLNGTTPEVIALLKAGKVDVALANLPFDDNALKIRRCFDIQDIFVAAAGDQVYSGQKVYTPAELARLPIIMLEKKSNSRQYIDSYFLQNGVSLTPEIELGSHDLLLQLTRIGLGVSCVIREFAKGPLDRGEIVELAIEPPIAPRSVGAVTLSGVTPSAACRRFLDIIGC